MGHHLWLEGEEAEVEDHRRMHLAEGVEVVLGLVGQVGMLKVVMVGVLVVHLSRMKAHLVAEVEEEYQQAMGRRSWVEVAVVRPLHFLPAVVEGQMGCVCLRMVAARRIWLVLVPVREAPLVDEAEVVDQM